MKLKGGGWRIEAKDKFFPSSGAILNPQSSNGA